MTAELTHNSAISEQVSHAATHAPAQENRALDSTPPPDLTAAPLTTSTNVVEPEKATPAKRSLFASIPGFSSVSKSWDKFTDSIRKGSPAAVVNNSPRAIFIMKIVADGFGILSGLGVFYKGADPEAKKKARSPLRIAANVISLAMLIPGTMYKETPVSKEQEQEYEKMGIGEYLWTKLKHAFNPKDHIVETAALGMMINGVLTIGSGMAQSSPDASSKEIKQGLFTVAAGAAWGLIPNRERAWQVSTAIFTARIPTKYQQAHDAYYKGLPKKGVPRGDMFQMGNFILQQLSNILSIFYAGVKKLPDGSIVRLGKKGEQEFEMKELQTKIPKIKMNKLSSADASASVEGTIDAFVSTSSPAASTIEHAAPSQPEALGTVLDANPVSATTRTLAESALEQQSPESTSGFAAKLSSERPEKLAPSLAASHAERAELSQASTTALSV